MIGFVCSKCIHVFNIYQLILSQKWTQNLGKKNVQYCCKDFGVKYCIYILVKLVMEIPKSA